MRREDLFEAIGMVKESQLAVCEKHRNPSVVTHREDSKMKNGKYAANSKRKGMPKIWLIAAIIAAMVFLMGCAWIILRMQDMKLGDETLYYDIFDDEGFAGREPVEMEVLTFAGVKGSPSYQAAKEWFDFLHSYDPDNKIYESVWHNWPKFPDAYSAYHLYSQEMKDSLDGILKKYNLKPVGSLLSFNSMENVCAALEIDKFTVDTNGVKQM